MTNQKFIRRFNYVEEHSLKQGLDMKQMTIDELESLWQQAKQEEKH